MDFYNNHDRKILENLPFYTQQCIELDIQYLIDKNISYLSNHVCDNCKVT